MKSNHKINQHPYEVKWGPWRRYIKIKGGGGGSLQLGLVWVFGSGVMMAVVRLVQVWEICLKSAHNSWKIHPIHPKSNWNCKPKFTTHSQIQIGKEKEGGLEKKKKEEGKSEKERERRFREKERKSWRVFKGGWGHLGRC